MYVDSTTPGKIWKVCAGRGPSAFNAFANEGKLEKMAEGRYVTFIFSPVAFGGNDKHVRVTPDSKRATPEAKARALKAVVAELVKLGHSTGAKVRA